MKQNFSKQEHQKFIKYFGIKEKESEIEKIFYKKAEKYIGYIKWIPGLKMIGVGNSISMNCSTSDSDIDLLIVTSNNSMWLNRIIITFIFQILGVRKNTKKHAGRFCLSFFVTEKGMDFSSWKIENDIYLYFWNLYFKPILDFDNTYEKFIEINSSWADFGEYTNMIEKNKNYIKYKSPHTIFSQREKGSYKKISKNIPYIPLPLGEVRGGLNFLLKKLFLPKTIKRYNSLGKPYGVIINDNLLKFHNNDIRKQIKKDLAS